MENSLSRHLGYRLRYAPTDVQHVRDVIDAEDVQHVHHVYTPKNQPKLTKIAIR